MKEANEMYLLGRSVPWWRPDDDQVTGMQLLAMPHIHGIYEEIRHAE